ncbi:MAG: hypothetical protein ACKVT1_13540 [Dehalococcoidia bacterium]
MVQIRPDPLNGKPFTREMLTPELMDAVFGTPQESAARTRLFKANMRRANAARAEFPGEYIAVVACEVVAHTPDRDLIFEQLERLGLLAAEGLGIARPARPGQ